MRLFLYSNFGVIKCYKLVFSIAGKLENLDFDIWNFNTFSYTNIFLLFFNTINPISKFIIGEMVKYNYIQVKENDKISKSIASSVEKNLRQKYITNKKRKSKKNIYKHKNYSSKTNITYYSKKDKNTIETNSENRINNKNDKINSNEKKMNITQIKILHISI